MQRLLIDNQASNINPMYLAVSVLGVNYCPNPNRAPSIDPMRPWRGSRCSGLVWRVLIGCR